VSVPPDLAVSELVKRLKGRSSRLLLEEFGELRKVYWGRHLWARGYFVASSGNVTDEVIAEYIEKQVQRAPEEADQDFSVEDL
jgi:REP-associated tyrosine transposase